MILLNISTRLFAAVPPEKTTNEGSPKGLIEVKARSLSFLGLKAVDGFISRLRYYSGM
jgi:hypothetical protein